MKVNGYCRDLVVKGGKRLAKIYGMEEMDKSLSCELMLNMVRKASDKARSCAESHFKLTCDYHS